MHIKNGLVFQEDKTFQKTDVYTLQGTIVTKAAWQTARQAASREAPGRLYPVNGERFGDFYEIDASGDLILPGLIDIHSHGAVGYDFSDANPEGLRKILRYQRSCGITSYCPTSMTLPLTQLLEIFSAGAEVSEACAKDTGCGSSPEMMAHIAGFNMEGPFLDPVKKGAHRKEDIQAPDVSFFRQCNECCHGQIRLVTLAPNMAGAFSFLRELRDETVISLGHTSCDYDTAKRAIDAGARHLTHLYNAMPEFLHRSPGLIGAAADSPDCMAELIADGIHSHDSMIRNAFRLFPDRIILISDSLRATGLADGAYELGGQRFLVKGRLATLSDGTIAGSCTNLFDCMRHAVAAGIPKEEAIAAATIHPAKSIGIYDRTGSISVGKKADLLLTDTELHLKMVL